MDVMPSPGPRPHPATTAPGDDTLRIDVRRCGAAPVVEVHGDLDVAGAPLLRAITEHVAVDGTPVAVDLSGVSFADSHGLAPVLTRDVVLVAVSAPVRRLLRLLGAPEARGLPPRPRFGRRRLQEPARCR